MSSKRKKIPLSVIKELIEELESIENELPYEYIDDDEEDGGLVQEASMESEDIETFLSALISTFTSRCNLDEEPNDLAGLMEAMFSADDDVVGIATNLEDSINGYFGSLFGEDLQMARSYFRDLVGELKEKLKRWKQEKDLHRKLIS